MASEARRAEAAPDGCYNRCMIPEGKVLAEDGVAVVARGDTFIMVYQAPSRLVRTKWMFAWMDKFLAQRSGGIVVFVVVLPTSDPPDGPTRKENAAQLRKFDSRLRLMVSAAVGDAFRTAIVRTVMRALAAIHGKSGVHFVVNTIHDGVNRVREAASEDTPSRSQLMEDLRAAHSALGVELPA